MSLRFVERLIDHHRGNSELLLLAAGELVAQKRLDQAQILIESTLHESDTTTNLHVYSSLLQVRARIQFLKSEPLVFAMPVQLSNISLLELQAQSHPVSDNFVQSSTALHDRLPLNLIPSLDSSTILLLYQNVVITNLYGVNDLAGYPCWSSCLIRGDLTTTDSYPFGLPVNINPNRFNITVRLERAFYLNNVYTHFGHFLTDTVSALSSLLLFKDENGGLPNSLPLILHPSTNDDGIHKILDIIGVERDSIFVPGVNCRDIFCQQLFLSAPTTVNGLMVSPRHEKAVRIAFSSSIRENDHHPIVNDSRHKIYVSRSRLSSKLRKLSREYALEKQFRKAGWHIFHPQEQDIATQLQVYQNASYICSQQSSALHLLYGIRKSNIRLVIILSWTSSDSNYSRQFSSQGIPLSVIECLCAKGGGDVKNTSSHVQLRPGMSPERITAMVENMCS